MLNRDFLNVISMIKICNNHKEISSIVYLKIQSVKILMRSFTLQKIFKNIMSYV